jgi:hypothetical protein
MSINLPAPTGARRGGAFLDEFQALVDDREGSEAQEVHLEETYFLHAVHIELGNPIPPGAVLH